MSNMYRLSGGALRRPPSKKGGIAKLLGLLLLAVGVFALAVWWFRREPPAEEVVDEVVADAAATDMRLAAESVTAPVVNDITLTAVHGAAANGVAHREKNDVKFLLTVVATLPAIDSTTTAYEAWFVKPGITDFFSLGELYPREDGKWGLVFEQTTALVRNDITAFNRIIIIREPRNGDAAPSADHVLQGVFE